MSYRGVHEINQQVREHERRQQLMAYTLAPEHPHNSTRSRQLRSRLAWALRELAARIEARSPWGTVQRA